MISISKVMAAKVTMLVNAWGREQGIGSIPAECCMFKKKKKKEIHTYKSKALEWKIMCPMGSL